MRILIFGATGGTGRELVSQALEGGHEVTAFVRTPSWPHLQDPRLRVHPGDVRNPDAIRAAVPGHEATLPSHREGGCCALHARGAGAPAVCAPGRGALLLRSRASYAAPVERNLASRAAAHWIMWNDAGRLGLMPKVIVILDAAGWPP